MSYAEELPREIYDRQMNLPDTEDIRMWCETIALTALPAIAALAERGGPKLVMREPTIEMCEAGPDGDFSAAWDAAPSVPDGIDEH